MESPVVRAGRDRVAGPVSSKPSGAGSRQPPEAGRTGRRQPGPATSSASERSTVPPSQRVGSRANRHTAFPDLRSAGHRVRRTRTAGRR